MEAAEADEQMAAADEEAALDDLHESSEPDDPGDHEGSSAEEAQAVEPN